MHSSRNKYIIISPVKDEGEFVESTIKSVINQNVKPEQWIIVDDGSQDRTPFIVGSYCKQYDWIRFIRIKRDSNRQPGSGVIQAFNHGYNLVKNEDYDFIVKLDCDLLFNSDYFEKLFEKFQKDPILGIASGIYVEKENGSWYPIKMPFYHAAGASKVVRKRCFTEIGGFVPLKGWDTIDEIKAQTKGWKTCHFIDIQFHHLKIEGSGIGHIRTNSMHGEIYYLTGGSKLFFLMKVINRAMYGKPFAIGGVVMLLGFIRAMLLRKKLLVSKEEARFYKRLLERRIYDKIKHFNCFQFFHKSERGI